MINWTVRFKNKNFWVALIPALILFIQNVLNAVGVHFDFTQIQTSLLAIVDALFVVLAILGIVTDPTTEGVGDSIRALGYTQPHSDQ